MRRIMQATIIILSVILIILMYAAAVLELRSSHATETEKVTTGIELTNEAVAETTEGSYLTENITTTEENYSTEDITTTETSKIETPVTCPTEPLETEHPTVESTTILDSPECGNDSRTPEEEV